MNARKRRINIPLIKGAVMGAFGLVLGLWGGFTGLGTQPASAGLAQAMLGLRPERMGGASAVFGLAASLCGVAGARAGGMHLPWTPALLLAVSAAIGAIVGVSGARAHVLRALRKAVLAMAMFGALATMGWALHASGVPGAGAEPCRSPGAYALVGFCAGLVSGLFDVPAGVLIILAVVRLCNVDGATGIAYGLAVAALAGVLPALAHLAAGTVPGGAMAWMYVFGGLGAAAGGAMLAHLPPGSALPMIAFGLSGAYLCAWRLWRLGSEEPPQTPSARRV